MKRKWIPHITAVTMVAVFAALGLASAASAPKTFVRSASGGDWSTILLRDGLSYDLAFGEVLDTCAKRFEMDMISKDGAYGRTKWAMKLINGSESYRTRVLFKFSADKTKVDIKTEAEFLEDGVWVKGYDTQVLATMKEDISGAVGRVVM